MPLLKISWDPVLLIFFEVEEPGSSLHGAIGTHLLLGGEERRMRRKGESLEIDGEKTVTRLEVAESIRNMWGERLWLLFTTLVCLKGW